MLKLLELISNVTSYCP